MDKNALDELKQFIAFAISQQTSDLREDIKEVRGDINSLHGDVKGLDSKIDNLSESVAEALTTSNDEVDKQLKSHDIRITKLESNPA